MTTQPAAWCAICEARWPLAYEVKRCVLCGSLEIRTRVERDRVIVASCASCGAVVRTEFEPPDDPTIRGRIELLVAPARRTKPRLTTH